MTSSDSKSITEKVVCHNRKARHDFFIEKSLEAGIALMGSEVKSLREGRAHLNEAFVDIIKGQAYLVGAHISPYGNATHVQHEPTRTRKLLLNQREIRKYEREVSLKGQTLIPLRIYFKGPYAKVEIALAKGKKNYDKREDIKKKDVERDLRRMGKTLQ
jgi:SsrA-binding protein